MTVIGKLFFVVVILNPNLSPLKKMFIDMCLP